MATITSKLVEMAENMGVDISDCQSGNIKTVLDAITTARGGEVLDSGVIATGVHSLAGTVEPAEETPGDVGTA